MNDAKEPQSIKKQAKSSCLDDFLKEPRKKLILGVARPVEAFLAKKVYSWGEIVFTLLESVNHFYWTFCQASSGQGAYTRTHF